MAEKEELVRFGVSFPAPLIVQFDRYIDEQGYTNRSEAIRDMARRALLEPSRMSGQEHVAGTIVLVYDHHVSDLPIVLMEVQHRFHHDIISNMHVHLNHDQCLEVIVVRGELMRLRELHQQIQAQKGVIYADLSVTYADKHDVTKEHKHT
ncbi:nickel-responsive transcriptional regulator NikR [Paenibacillus sinopodophylli]|uniref:nickel-responsive transcriptional regulator NikR n=1 Tax=Paenibacillus sinopodophylli TaxID=1837342 RepID=UPI00110CD1D7|nr:nickel-responsive transcriptional regulator NikR [Paenibacillus sinopodophylli]